jgi:eukaryotic-like serine/threonine-protein kinase
LAFATREGPGRGYDIVVLTLATGTLRHLTLDAVNDRAPLWSPDGESIVYLSFKDNAPGIYRKAASGIGAEELVLPSPGVAWPYQWPNENMHYFAGISGNNGLWMIARDGTTTLLLETRFNEVDGALSPDGAWYAYTQNETGRFQVYVTTFPPSSTKLVITTHGGADPFWSADGRDLYYIKPSTAELMAVAVTPGSPPRFGAVRRVHPGPFFYPDAHAFYLHPDGERILVAPSSEPVADIAVMLNWQAALR